MLVNHSPSNLVHDYNLLTFLQKGNYGFRIFEVKILSKHTQKPMKLHYLQKYFTESIP